MPKIDSLITAYVLDGNGGGKKIGWNEIDSWSPEQGTLWVHLNFTAQRAIKWLSKESGVDKFVAKAMVQEESRPRVVTTPKGVLLLLRGVNLNPGQDPEDMVSIRIWMDEHCVITTRRRKLLSVDDICFAIDEGIGPKTSVEFVKMLNERLLSRIANVVENIDDSIDELEQDILTECTRILRPKISELRRQAISIRRYLAPQREGLRKLYYDEISFFTPTDKIDFREANDRIVRYIEDLDSARERAAVTQEELTSRLSDQTNQRMYVLSIVTVIFLPLSFVTGLLGINVAGIPGANYPPAFAIVCGGLFAILLAISAWLAKKKWI